MAGTMIEVVYAHPYPSRSRACAALLEALAGTPGLEVRSLYALYPDFDIDADAEREALARARLLVLMHPLYWYTAPSLLKLWFEQVLVKGWAYGEGGNALAGKDCLWIPTTGARESEYRPGGRHGHPLDAFQPVVEQTARYCGMNWLDPFVVHGAHLVAPAELHEAGRQLRRRIDAWQARLATAPA